MDTVQAATLIAEPFELGPPDGVGGGTPGETIPVNPFH